MGYGFGIVWPASSALIGNLIPTEQRQRYFGINFTLLNLGIGIGGIVGGRFVDVDSAGHVRHGLPARRAQLRAGAVHPARPAAPGPRPGRAAGRRRRPTSVSYLALLRDPRLRALLLLVGVAALVSYPQLNAGMPAYAAGRGAGLDRGARLRVRRQHRRHRRCCSSSCSSASRGGAARASPSSWPSRGWWPGRCSGRRRSCRAPSRRRSCSAACAGRLRARRDDAPADERRDGQRPRARPPARPLQRAQLADVLGRVRRRSGRRELLIGRDCGGYVGVASAGAPCSPSSRSSSSGACRRTSTASVRSRPVAVPRARPRAGRGDFRLTSAAAYTGRRHPAWWYLSELPQGRNAARVGELFQVRGVSLFSCGAGRLAVRAGERWSCRPAGRPAG